MPKTCFGQASIAVASLLFIGPALAMQIQLFDRMAAQDQQDYINLLMQGAEKVLIEAGRSDDAAKVHKLFHEISPGSELPLGEAEFEMNLDNARVADAERHLKEPDAPRLQVEHAMIVTLKKNGINLPKTFMTVASNFKASRPLAGEVKAKPQEKK
jgi:hypothetical protein